ncbi:MAG: hypothetical protein PHE20_01585 [Patescibacteria group bacterium]|nr:hypothetical protein [Patescibacteria group bacterium]
MEIKTNDFELKPVEALYLLSLSKQEIFNAKNALTAIIAYLFEEQILNLKHGGIKLTKRGYELKINSHYLDSIESAVSWFIHTDDHERIFPFIVIFDFSSSLLRKKMIVKEEKKLFHFLSFSRNKFALSRLGEERVSSLLKLRDDIITHNKVPDIAVISIFPSIHFRLSHKNMTAIRHYVQKTFTAYRKRVKSAWLNPGQNS